MVGYSASNLRVIASVLALILCGQSVAAQDIPGDIPDGPNSVPEEQQETLKERHRDLLSRFYTGTQLSAAPTFNRDVAAYGIQLETGFQVTRESALYLSFGVREYVVQNEEGAEAGSPVSRPGGRSNPFAAEKETITLFAISYDLGLAQFVRPTRFARRSALGIGIGGALGDAHLLTMELAPKYVLPVDEYWSLPVGLKIGQAVLGADRTRVRGTYVGLSIGVKRFYGQRGHLK